MALHPQPAPWASRPADPSHPSHTPHAPQTQPPHGTSAISATSRRAKPGATPARLDWRRVVCSLLLACGLATLTAAPLAQPAFADEWCTSC